jgi:ABC-2 type transport system permease protein
MKPTMITTPSKRMKKGRRNNMNAIYTKELKGYFRNVTGFVFFAFMSAIIGIYAAVINFSYAYPNFEYVLTGINFIFLLVVPLLTMRAISEERHQKTDQLIYSLPIKISKVVLGKFFAVLTVFALPLLLSAIYPLILSLYDPSGYISYASSYGTLLAFFLLGAALISIGLFMSSLTENQIISAVMCFGAVLLSILTEALANIIPSSVNASFFGFIVILILVAFLIYFLTKNSNLAWLSFIVLDIPLVLIRFIKSDLLYGALPSMLKAVSLFDKLDNFASGIFDITALIYYISIMALFLFFTVQSMEKRRWS